MAMTMLIVLSRLLASQAQPVDTQPIRQFGFGPVTQVVMSPDEKFVLAACKHVAMLA